MDFAKILPLAFVMIAGPQILSAIFLATSERWRANSFAFVAGAAISISVFVTAAYLVTGGGSDGGPSGDTLDIVVLVLLLLAAAHVYRTRAEATPPKWMGKLQTATPGLSFKLGLLLLGVFPTDILTSFAVGSYLANHGDDLWQALPFIGLTLLILAIPSLIVISLGERGETLLPKVRDWMNDNSWIVSEIVIFLFIGLVANDIWG
jgi:hypothetical protein